MVSRCVSRDKLSAIGLNTPLMCPFTRDAFDVIRILANVQLRSLWSLLVWMSKEDLWSQETAEVLSPKCKILGWWELQSLMAIWTMRREAKNSRKLMRKMPCRWVGIG